MTSDLLRPPRSGPHRPATELPWHHHPPEYALRAFMSTLDGLPQHVAEERLQMHGPNAIVAPPRVHPWTLMAGQFKSLIIWLLIAAGVVAWVFGDAVEAIAILAIVFLNAGIGFFQEFHAERSLAALRLLSAPLARVRRDGVPREVPASDVVTGDVLLLAAGDIVAADVRLLEAHRLHCIESALTGESEAVLKDAPAVRDEFTALGDRDNMAFMGTSVSTGLATGVVVAVAMDTELGRIAGLIEQTSASPKTPLQHRLDTFGHILVWATLGIVGLLFMLGLWRGTPLLDSILTSISLAVAAVPEGLPAVVTVALSLGVVRMARRRALVRRLPAVETLGSTSVICADKTGTLTMGQMTVRRLFVAGTELEVSGVGYAPEGEVRMLDGSAPVALQIPLEEFAANMLGANHAHLALEAGEWRVLGDPTEGALLVAAHKAGADRERLEHLRPRVHELPFDPDRKCSTIVRRLPDGSLRAFVNGAPDVLLAKCTHLYTARGVRELLPDDHASIVMASAAMARQSMRVLGSCMREVADGPPESFTADQVERDLTFVGLAGLHDPPRPAARAAVAACHEAGIQVVMITGDHPVTASAIAHELGIAPADARVVTGTALDAMDERRLRSEVEGILLYARVTASHKLRIVRAWQAHHAVVAMTGDGVNDAPAIRGADIGVAMGRTGTEVTKQAADLIVTDDDFATIVAAVAEGRAIYSNIRKTLQYLLAGNTGELLLMTVCLTVGVASPLRAIHLLWINLVTDGLPALCLATDPPSPGVMTQPPRPRSERIANPRFLRAMLLTGVLTGGVALFTYLVLSRSRTLADAQTGTFTVLVFAELLRSFGARSERLPVWRMEWRTQPALLWVVGLSIALQFWILGSPAWGHVLKTTPLSLELGLKLLAVGAIPSFVIELQKEWRFGHRPVPVPATPIAA